MSCSKTLQDLKIAEKVAQDAYDEAKKQDDDAKAALDLATQQEAAEKKRKAGSILFTVFGEKLVSECRIPTEAVAQLGLFRILLGAARSDGETVVVDAQPKWMWRQEYQHHEQLPLAFNGTWPSWNSDLDNRPW